VIRWALRTSSRRGGVRTAGLTAAVVMCLCPARAQPQDLAFPGGIIWQTTLAPPPVQLPAFDDRRVYLVMGDGSVLAVDHATGTSLWSTPARSTVRPAASGRYLAGADGATAWAIDAGSGEVAWSRDLGARVSAVPAVTDAGAAMLTEAGDLVLLAWADGREAWRVRLPGESSAPLAADGDRLFVGLADGRVRALALPDGATVWERTLGGRVLGLTPIGDRLFTGAADNFLYALKVRDGGTAWRWRTGGDVVALAVADERRVYFTSLDAMLRAMDRRHGDLRWQRPLAARAVGGPAMAGTIVVVAGVSPELRAFRTSDGGLVATAPLPGRPLHGPHLAPDGPTAPARLIVLTAGGHLLALGQTVEPMLVPLDVIPGRKLPPEVLPEIIRQ
jgi:outer membrane protein assembly factor BamB